MTASNKESHNYKCPYTENNRFQIFVDEILKLKLPDDKLKRNLCDYMRVMETFYADKIREFQKRMKNVQREEKDKRAKIGFTYDKRTELEEILGDCIEKTRIKVFRRRMRQERQQKHQ